MEDGMADLNDQPDLKDQSTWKVPFTEKDLAEDIDVGNRIKTQKTQLPGSFINVITISCRNFQFAKPITIAQDREGLKERIKSYQVLHQHRFPEKSRAIAHY